MEIVQSIILGFVQGLAEFLPISSSGHLILIPDVFGWKDQGLAFDVALHWGTLVAVLMYFWKDWIKILKESYLLNKVLNTKYQIPNTKSISNKEFQKNSFNFQSSIVVENRVSGFKFLKSDLLFIIVIATIPGVVAGLLLNSYAETVFRNPLLIAATLSVGALLLFYSDKIGIKKLDINKLTLKDGLIIGFAQALAIIPGVSRSGITITMALLLGMNRTSAARFSFLLSTPIILGAGIKELPNLLNNGIGVSVIIGAVTAAITGYLAIKYMIKYLKNNNYNVFVIYRILLALIIIFVFIF
jgi:undecaprenyl-diphosphatase